MNAFADEVYERTNEMNTQDFEEFKETYEQEINKTLKKEIEIKFEKSPNSRHKYIYEARFGTLVDETNHIVERENIDNVVMGTKGKINNKDITFGSKT